MKKKPARKPAKKRTARKARAKSASAEAGEFVRDEIRHVREGKHGARSPQQIIAIALSKARRAGVKLAVPKAGTTSERIRRRAESDLAEGARTRARGKRKPSARRSRAAKKALQKEGHTAASHEALSRRAKESAARRKES